MAKVKGEFFICIPLEFGLKLTGFLELILGSLLLTLYLSVLTDTIEDEDVVRWSRAMMRQNAVAHYGLYGIAPEYMSVIVALFFAVAGLVLLIGIYMSSNICLKVVWISKIIFSIFFLINIIVNIIAYFSNDDSMVYTTIGHFVFMGYLAYRTREYDKKLEAIMIRALPC